MSAQSRNALTFAEASRLVHSGYNAEYKRAARLFAAAIQMCKRAVGTSNEAMLCADIEHSKGLIEKAQRQLAATARLQKWANEWQWRALQ